MEMFYGMPLYEWIAAHVQETKNRNNRNRLKLQLYSRKIAASVGNSCRQDCRQVNSKVTRELCNKTLKTCSCSHLNLLNITRRFFNFAKLIKIADKITETLPPSGDFTKIFKLVKYVKLWFMCKQLQVAIILNPNFKFYLTIIGHGSVGRSTPFLYSVARARIAFFPLRFVFCLVTLILQTCVFYFQKSAQ